MSPIIKVCTSAEHNPCASRNMKGRAIYQVEIDGRTTGPVMMERDANIIARWLDENWESLP